MLPSETQGVMIVCQDCGDSKPAGGHEWRGVCSCPRGSPRVAECVSAEVDVAAEDRGSLVATHVVGPGLVGAGREDAI